MNVSAAQIGLLLMDKWNHESSTQISPKFTKFRTLRRTHMIQVPDDFGVQFELWSLHILDVHICSCVWGSLK